MCGVVYVLRVCGMCVLCFDVVVCCAVSLCVVLVLVLVRNVWCVVPVVCVRGVWCACRKVGKSLGMCDKIWTQDPSVTEPSPHNVVGAHNQKSSQRPRNNATSENCIEV